MPDDAPHPDPPTSAGPDGDRPARPWGSYADWLLHGRGEVESVEQRTRGGVPVQLVLARQREAFPDPPTPDLALVLIRGGGCENVGVDFGHGRFSGVRAGQFVLAPADRANDYRGGRDFELLNAAFPAAALTGLADRAGLRPPDLGPLHAGPFRDEALARLVGIDVGTTRRRTAAARRSLYADGLFTAVSRPADGARRRPAPAAPAPGAARRAVASRKVDDYLRAHLADGAADPDALADLAGYSRFHFDRLFKAATGLTPPQRLTSPARRGGQVDAAGPSGRGRS